MNTIKEKSIQKWTGKLTLDVLREELVSVATQQ